MMLKAKLLDMISPLSIGSKEAFGVSVSIVYQIKFAYIEYNFLVGVRHINYMYINAFATRIANSIVDAHVIPRLDT